MIDNELLKYYRELNNLTIKELAKKLKCPKRIIELWETGEIIPKESDITKLCEIYNITIEDLIKQEKNSLNIIYFITSIILIALGIISGYISKNITIMILFPIINLTLLYSSIYIIKQYEISKSIDDEEPRSLFGIILDQDIKKERIKDYLIESNLIAAAYLAFNIICKLFELNDFIINITLFDNKSVNDFVILTTIYLQLMISSFIIEIGFGEYMIKKYKGDKNEK